MAYETDPDVAAFLGGTKKTASADVANKKSSMSGVRLDLQPDSETDYTTDPDVNAFLTVPKQKIDKAQSLTTQALQKAFEMKRQIAPTLASIGDVTIGGVIPAVVGGATYAGARAIGKTPEQATQIEHNVVGTIDKPFGKALGVTQNPAYQQSAAMQMMDYISKNVNKGADWIAENTGMDKRDAQWWINAAAMKAAPTVGKGVVTGVGVAENPVDTGVGGSTTQVSGGSNSSGVNLFRRKNRMLVSLPQLLHAHRFSCSSCWIGHPIWRCNEQSLVAAKRSPDYFQIITQCRQEF